MGSLLVIVPFLMLLFWYRADDCFWDSKFVLCLKVWDF